MSMFSNVFQKKNKLETMEGTTPSGDNSSGQPKADADQEATISPALAAAVAIALHLNLQANQNLLPVDDSQAQTTSSWAQFGRSQLMTDRLSAFDRVQRY